MTSRAQAEMTVRWLTDDDEVLLTYRQQWGRRRGGKGWGPLRRQRPGRRMRVREMSPAWLRWRPRS